jgi:Leucine-rich repeat (LRR) protein
MATFNGITLEDLEYLHIILNDDLQELNYQFRDSKYIEKLKNKLKYLNQLHITYNEGLKILPESVFDLLIDNFIIDLTISNNQLESLNSKVFNNLIKLTFLSISNNHLKNLPDTIFDNLNILETLDLANNK